MLINIKYLHSYFLMSSMFKILIPLYVRFFFLVVHFLFFSKKLKYRKLKFLCKHSMESKWFFLYTCLFLNHFFFGYIKHKGFSFYFHKKYKIFTIVKSPSVFKKVKEHLGVDKYTGLLSFWLNINTKIQVFYIKTVFHSYLSIQRPLYLTISINT